MRAVIIDNGVVANVIEVDSLDVIAGLIDGEGAAIGDTWDGATFTKPVPPAPPEAQIVAGYMAGVQEFMDKTAVSFGYDNLLSVVSYADEPAVPRYQSEGQAFRAWRSQVWSHCEQVRADVSAGTRTQPTSDQLIAELPSLGIKPNPAVQAA